MVLAVLLALGASVCWALANVFIQRAGRAVGPVRALLWCQVVGGAALAGFAAALDQRTPVAVASIAGWAALAGVSATVAYGCMFFAFERAALSVAVPVMSSWALIAAAVSVGLLGERVRPAQALGGLFVIAGVVLVARGAGPSPAAGHAELRLRDLLASLGAAVGFGLLVPSIAHIAPAAGRLGSVDVVYALDIALGLPIVLALRLDVRPPSGAAWWPVVGAAFFETLGFACVSVAAGHAPVAVVAPCASLSAVLTVVYGWLVLRERPTRVVAVGAVMASSGVVVLSL